ncbi:hypothetical protein [Gordonia sp. UCD-TK1]|uniref:hypothetical protein n=1 Tax=Gordonia sp. UCD-TK1 TaxID=1857893 RepID=UPI00080DFCFE|nr:hypothetical protein [Gordonia sp. UCD-TK1]OCH82227.1 hypothetical protein A9310_14690 [Gordonia sp. UCD-TK1]
MDGGSRFGLHLVWARFVLVAVLVLLVVTVPVQQAGAIDAPTDPESRAAVTAPGLPYIVGPPPDSAVGRPLSSSSRGGEDRRPVLARVGARPTAEHTRISVLDREALTRFD